MIHGVAGVNQCAERHVSTNARKTIKISESHSDAAAERWDCTVNLSLRRMQIDTIGADHRVSNRWRTLAVFDPHWRHLLYWRDSIASLYVHWGTVYQALT